MEIKKVLVHSCLKREQGFDEDNPLPANCKCRRWITMEEAKQFVEDGEAAYVAVLHRVIESEEDCKICGRDPKFIKSCIACDRTGIIKLKKPIVIRGEDIVFISRLKKTPRTATIEKAHIERTIEGHKDEALRSTYQEILTVEFHGSLGAEIIERPSGIVIKPGTPEPENDQRKGTGRRFDYGRPV